MTAIRAGAVRYTTHRQRFFSSNQDWSKLSINRRSVENQSFKSKITASMGTGEVIIKSAW